MNANNAIAWVFHSPRRLAATIVVVLAVVLLGGSALFGESFGGGGGTSEEQPKDQPKAQAPDPAPYVSAALEFVKDWSKLRPGETAQQWQAELTPLTTPELGQALKTTDPAQLPGVQPTGDPVVRYVADTSALIAVPLADGTSVLVSVVAGEQRMLVSDVQPNVGD